MISLLIIGNEILSAQIEETNLRHMLKHLNRAGYHVDEVRIIADTIEAISDAVRDLSKRSTFVISTGGVGPTHDDVTLEAYARAFDEALIEHPELVAKMRAFFGDDLKPSSLRMARVPANTTLVDAGPDHWPIVRVGNCFVLPGLPEIFVKKFAGVLAVLPPVPGRYYAELRSRAHEVEFADYLSATQVRWPDVEIGSYPTYHHPEFAAKITLKGRALDQVQGVFDEIRQFFIKTQMLAGSREPHPYQPGTD